MLHYPAVIRLRLFFLLTNQVEGLKPAYASKTQNRQREKSQFDRTDGLGDGDMRCLTLAGKRSGNFVLKIDRQRYISYSSLTACRICFCLQLSRTRVFYEVLSEDACRWHRWWTSWWTVRTWSSYDIFCLPECSQTWLYVLATSWIPSPVPNNLKHCYDRHLFKALAKTFASIQLCRHSNAQWYLFSSSWFVVLGAFLCPQKTSSSCASGIWIQRSCYRQFLNHRGSILITFHHFDIILGGKIAPFPLFIFLLLSLSIPFLFLKLLLYTWD